MISFPNAKINIGLEITGRRSDGYHNIESLFLPIPLFDALEFVESTGSEDRFISSGLAIPGDPATNLCLKALAEVRLYAAIPPLQIHLHKVIPMGAGLGGGSADAAFFIRMLDEYFELNLNRELQFAIAAKLGADCSFFLENQPCRVRGTGNELTPSDFNPAGLFLVLAYPEIHIDTATAYRHITPEQPAADIFAIIENKPPTEWAQVRNRFEEYVFIKYPQVAEIKNDLIKAGALYAAMSGSGSAVFGLFAERPNLKTQHLTGVKLFQMKLPLTSEL